MAVFKRMILVNEYEYFQLVKNAGATIEKTKATNVPIDQVQKLHAYNLAEEIKEAAAAASEDKVVESSIKQLPLSFIKLVIDKFPLHARARGHAILQKLLANGVTWDGEGQIKFVDATETLDNSNLIDLIYYAANEKQASKQLSPVGWSKFNSLLKSLSSKLGVSSPIKRKLEFNEDTPIKTVKKKNIIIGANYSSV